MSGTTQAALLAAAVAESAGFEWSTPPSHQAAAVTAEAEQQLSNAGEPLAAGSTSHCLPPAERRQPGVNPFRRPFRSMGRDNRLPAYSNGFVVVLRRRRRQAADVQPAAAEQPAVGGGSRFEARDADGKSAAAGLSAAL